MHDYARIARETIRKIGYNDPELRFDADGCAVMVCYGRQSPDIKRGVDQASDDHLNQGAGDQGLMFGYACDETPSLMPFPIYYAHRLVQRQSEVRKDGRLPWLRPDAKSQVTVRYVDGKPVAIDTVVLSTQHHPSMNDKQAELAEAVIEEIIKPVLPANMLKGTRYLVNPTGRFEIGGPHGDAGLTGRKIIVDTYGGAAPHGGGAFSGKDPSKVDRSAAYAARYVAKNIVAAGIATQCQVQLSYAIGVARPINVTVYTEGTGRIPGREDRGARQRALRSAAEGHHPDARSAAPDLSQDRRVRPFRPRRARVHLGSDRQGAGAARRPRASRARTTRRGKPKRTPDPRALRSTNVGARSCICSIRSPLRGLRLRQPHRRVADVPVLGRARLRDRLAPVHWGQMLLSGAGMFTIEATAVTAEGRITHGCLGLYDDATEEALGDDARARAPAGAADARRDPARARRAQGLVGAAVGRRHADSAVDKGGWTPVAPSAVPHADGEPAPSSARRRGSRGVRDAFVAAARARRSLRHRRDRAAHGARLSAARIPVADREPARRCVRRQLRQPHPLSARGLRRGARGVAARTGRSACALSATDWVDGGWTLERVGRVRASAEGARLRLDRRVGGRRFAGAADSRADAGRSTCPSRARSAARPAW